jgi:hypothetical protein
MTVNEMTASEMSAGNMTLDETPRSFEFGCEEKKNSFKMKSYE